MLCCITLGNSVFGQQCSLTNPQNKIPKFCKWDHGHQHSILGLVLMGDPVVLHGQPSPGVIPNDVESSLSMVSWKWKFWSFCFVLAYLMVCWFVVVQDDCDNVTRFLMLAREPVIPRNDRPFKVLLLFLQLCQWPFSSWFSFLEWMPSCF